MIHSRRELPGRSITMAGGLGEPVKGPALVTSDGFSARYDLDPATGIISRPSHPLYGKSVVGKVLVVSFAKGGVATSWRLSDLVDRGTAPLALVFGIVNPVMVQAAQFARLPIMHAADPKDLDGISDDAVLSLIPDELRIEVR